MSPRMKAKLLMGLPLKMIKLVNGVCVLHEKIWECFAFAFVPEWCFFVRDFTEECVGMSRDNFAKPVFYILTNVYLHFHLKVRVEWCRYYYFELNGMKCVLQLQCHTLLETLTSRCWSTSSTDYSVPKSFIVFYVLLKHRLVGANRGFIAQNSLFYQLVVLTITY